MTYKNIILLIVLTTLL